MRLILASQSPARLSVLRSAGIEPVVRVSGVDEDALIESLDNPTPEETVVALSAAKAEAIEHDDECVVVGCDSMLLFEGELVGKPGTPEVARERWQRVAGKSGVLITGHTVLKVSGGAVADRASAAESTTVRFGTPSDEELDAYIATGEPLHVAGGFTIDGLGGWFIDGIDGDHTSVIGISLPLTRRLLGQLGVSVSTLW